MRTWTWTWTQRDRPDMGTQAFPQMEQQKISTRHSNISQYREAISQQTTHKDQEKSQQHQTAHVPWGLAVEPTPRRDALTTSRSIQAGSKYDNTQTDSSLRQNTTAHYQTRAVTELERDRSQTPLAQEAAGGGSHYPSQPRSFSY